MSFKKRKEAVWKKPQCISGDHGWATPDRNDDRDEGKDGNGRTQEWEQCCKRFSMEGPPTGFALESLTIRHLQHLSKLIVSWSLKTVTFSEENPHNPPGSTPDVITPPPPTCLHVAHTPPVLGGPGCSPWLQPVAQPTLRKPRCWPSLQRAWAGVT